MDTGRSTHNEFTGRVSTNSISGTSMASPHVAGAAAHYISNQPSAVSPAEVKRALKSAAARNAITNPGTGSPNELLLQECGN